jgi:hypothetical protein
VILIYYVKYKIFANYEYGEIVVAYLFDLVDDPGETTDLSQEMPSLKEKMVADMEAWRQSVIKSVEKVGCLNTM